MHQRGADSLPVSVRLLNAGKSPLEAAQDSARIEAELSAKRWSVGFSIATLGVTLGLLVVAYRQWRTSQAQQQTAEQQRMLMDVQTTLMGNSIVVMDSQREVMRDQHESAKRIERAYMFLSTTPTRSDNEKIPLLPSMPRPLQFVNLGKTPARVETVIASCRHWPKGAVEALTEQPDGQKVETFGVWLAGGREPLGVKYVQCTASLDQIAMAVGGEGIIALIGHISYQDIFGDSHDFGFAYEMAGNPPILLEIPNRYLNYSR